MRILMSDRQEGFIDLVASVVHHFARPGIAVMQITPSSPRELDLLQRAVEENWDIAFLFLNNIDYGSRVRSPETIERDSVELVGKMTSFFKRPVIGFFGYPDSPTFSEGVLKAGAAAVFRLPCDLEDVEQAVKRCLPIW